MNNIFNEFTDTVIHKSALKDTQAKLPFLKPNINPKRLNSFA